MRLMATSVARREIRAHVSEPFWYIHAMYRAPEGQACVLHWQRERLFDHVVATILYDTCMEEPTATVTKVLVLSCPPAGCLPFPHLFDIPTPRDVISLLCILLLQLDCPPPCQSMSISVSAAPIFQTVIITKKI